MRKERLPVSTPVRRRGCFLGLATVDLQYVLARFPVADTKVFAQSQEFCAGGPATNAAVTFAHLGGEASLATVIGTHPLCSVIRSDLSACRVGLLDFAPDYDGSPPVASIITTPANGERTVIAARPPVPASVPPSEALAAWPEECDILLVDGHYLTVATMAVRAAAARQVPVVLDGGSWKPGLETLLEHVDIAICSEGFHPPGVAAGDATLCWLADRGINHVAGTRGSKPIRYLRVSSRGTFAEVNVPATTAVDTLGAGDVFHGAFCYYFLDGHDFAGSLAKAAVVAARACESVGTRAWMK